MVCSDVIKEPEGVLQETGRRADAFVLQKKKKTVLSFLQTLTVGHESQAILGFKYKKKEKEKKTLTFWMQNQRWGTQLQTLDETTK